MSAAVPSCLTGFGFSFVLWGVNLSQAALRYIAGVRRPATEIETCRNLSPKHGGAWLIDAATTSRNALSGDFIAEM